MDHIGRRVAGAVDEDNVADAADDGAGGDAYALDGHGLGAAAPQGVHGVLDVLLVDDEVIWGCAFGDLPGGRVGEGDLDAGPGDWAVGAYGERVFVGGAGLGVGGGEALDLRVELRDLVIEGFDLFLAVSHEGGQVGGGRGILAFVERGDGEEESGGDGDGEDACDVADAAWAHLSPSHGAALWHFPRPRLR